MISIYGSLVLLAFVNPIALDRIGWHYYIVSCVILVGICLTTYFYFPETRGHSLEEIAEIFDGKEYGQRVSVGVSLEKEREDGDSDVVLGGDVQRGGDEKAARRGVEHIDRVV